MKVLLAEDDEDQLEVRRMLLEHHGFTPLCAAGVDSALKLALKETLQHSRARAAELNALDCSGLAPPGGTEPRVSVGADRLSHPPRGGGA